MIISPNPTLKAGDGDLITTISHSPLFIQVEFESQRIPFPSWIALTENNLKNGLTT